MQDNSFFPGKGCRISEQGCCLVQNLSVRDFSDKNVMVMRAAPNITL